MKVIIRFLKIFGKAFVCRNLFKVIGYEGEPLWIRFGLSATRDSNPGGQESDYLDGPKGGCATIPTWQTVTRVFLWSLFLFRKVNPPHNTFS